MVMGGLGRGGERAALVARGAGIGRDELAQRAALGHGHGLVDQQQFLGCSRRARHRLAGHEHDRREDDAPQFLAACEIAHLEDGEIIVEREARLACKEPAVASAAAEGRDRGGEIAARLALRTMERMRYILHRSAAAECPPGPGYGPVTTPALRAPTRGPP